MISDNASHLCQEEEEELQLALAISLSEQEAKNSAKKVCCSNSSFTGFFIFILFSIPLI